jgi:NADH dehydrogenase FAD-containing subunit
MCAACWCAACARGGTGVGCARTRTRSAIANRKNIEIARRPQRRLDDELINTVGLQTVELPQNLRGFDIAQAHWHGFRYRFGEMVGLDRTRKEGRLAATFDEEGRQITPPSSVGYDTLVIAIGTTTNDFGTPGVSEHAVPLETPAQAARFELQPGRAAADYDNAVQPFLFDALVTAKRRCLDARLRACALGVDSPIQRPHHSCHF